MDCQSQEHGSLSRSGELSFETELDVLADLMYGAEWYRFLLFPAPLDKAFAWDMVELILRLNERSALARDGPRSQAGR
jgi:hypothetical protein